MTTNDRNQYLMSGVALAISAIAMVFTFLQLRAADRQLQADVWPYVDISITLQADVFDLQLSNKGLGPALIHEFRLVQDGVEVTHPLGLVHLAGRPNTGLAMQVGSVPDSVLAVGEDLTAFRITGEGLGLTMRDTIAAIAPSMAPAGITTPTTAFATAHPAAGPKASISTRPCA